MHDFCFSPLYAVVLAVGALLAYFSKGSTASLVAGGTAALITGAASYISMQVYLKQHVKCVSAVVVSLVVASGVTFKMGTSFLADPKNHILQGVLGGSSAIMVAYYLWNLALFRPSKPAAKAK